MKETLISFETAVLAKEKEFSLRGKDSECYLLNGELFPSTFNLQDYDSATGKAYKEFVYAPTQGLLQKWLREVRQTDITVIAEWDKGQRFYRVGISYVSKENKIEIWFSKEGDVRLKNYKTYEEALEVGLFEALKLIE